MKCTKHNQIAALFPLLNAVKRIQCRNAPKGQVDNYTPFTEVESMSQFQSSLECGIPNLQVKMSCFQKGSRIIALTLCTVTHETPWVASLYLNIIDSSFSFGAYLQNSNKSLNTDVSLGKCIPLFIACHWTVQHDQDNIGLILQVKFYTEKRKNNWIFCKLQPLNLSGKWGN